MADSFFLAKGKQYLNTYNLFFTFFLSKIPIVPRRHDLSQKISIENRSYCPFKKINPPWSPWFSEKRPLGLYTLIRVWWAKAVSIYSRQWITVTSSQEALYCCHGPVFGASIRSKKSWTTPSFLHTTVYRESVRLQFVVAVECQQ